MQGPRARENQNSENRLLEQKHGERLDIGTTGKAGKADPAMATVGEIDGAENKGGKEAISQNAYKGGTWKQLRELATALREQQR
jgi:hypothetical protein